MGKRTKPMNVQDFVEMIVAFVRTHEGWAVPIAFLVAFAESFCFLSLLWPGTAILVGISALLAASGASHTILLPAIIAAGVGGSIGYAASYWIGLYFKDSIHTIWPFRTRPELIKHGEVFFSRWGGWGVFFGHFFGPVRSVIPIVAGMFRMKQLPFQIANIVSSFIWAAGVIAPSFFLVTFREEIVMYIRDHQVLVAFLLFAAAFLNSIPMPLMAIPTLLLFLLLGAAYVYAGGDPVMGVLAGTLGAFLGDAVGYYKGRKHAADDLHVVYPNSWSPESAQNALTFTSKWGVSGLIASKFRTTLRSFVPLAAGVQNLSFVPFLIAGLVSSLLWTLALMAPVAVAQRYFGG